MKRILLWIAAALVLWSCSDALENKPGKNNGLPYDPSAVVCFTTEISTRGTPVSYVKDMTTLGVFCTRTNGDWTATDEPDWMEDIKLLRSGAESSEAWTYAEVNDTKKWGATSATYRYTFFAYAPYGTGLYSVTDETTRKGNGITLKYQNDDYTYKDGIPVLKYTVPTSTENQPDLMVAVPKYDLPRQTTPVELEMKHALTCVGFQIAGNNDRITGIAIKGVYMSGTLKMDGSNIKWTLDGPKNTEATLFNALINYDDDNGYYTATQSMSNNLMKGNGYLMMIPQELGEDAKLVITREDAEPVEIDLNTRTWEAGKKVNYRITLTPDGGGTVTLTPDELILFGWSSTDPYRNEYQTAEITVTCSDEDTSWELTYNPSIQTQDWLRISTVPNKTFDECDKTLSGKGTQTVYIYAKTAASYRSGVIKLDDGGENKEVNVYQPTVTHAGSTSTYLQKTKRYVGAFWKADQTGERLITFPSNGTWKWCVQVYDYGEDFKEGDIVFSTEASKDPGITWNRITENPADPDGTIKYPVDGDATYLKRSDNDGTFFFRIGLKNKWSDHPKYNSVTKPARYAVIMLVYTANANQPYTYADRIWLRQGEEADYLMRPGDPATNVNVNVNVNGRTLPVKYSPYNLTAREFKGTNSSPDFVRLAVNEGVWTNYPSQAGAHFPWADGITNAKRAVAYHPTVITPSGWSNSSATGFWNALKGAHESCPTGYRRPTDGNATNLTAVVAANISASNSEMGQSLFLNPPSGLVNANSNTDNVIWGYYADGFFDRREIRSQGFYDNPNGNGELAAVDTDKSTVAYIGHLFYNPYNNASLFFPDAGYRTGDYLDGRFMLAETHSYYWSASSVDNKENAYALYIHRWLRYSTVEFYATRVQSSRKDANPIRCVRE